MIIEVSFTLAAGGLNLGLERYWEVVRDLIAKYPGATWKKIIHRGRAKYLIEIDQ